MEERLEINRGGRATVGLILVFLGLAFLLGNFFHVGGALFLGGLGAAFIVARFWTGRSGLAVPGAILAGLGVFVGLEERHAFGGNAGAVFLTILGLSFLLIYFLQMRWQSYWSLVVGIVLAFLGIAALGRLDLIMLRLEVRRAFTTWWPSVLVLLGFWLLVRNGLAPSARRAVGAVVTVVVLITVAIALAVSSGLR